MAIINAVKSTLVTRNDLAENWADKNPLLAKGELAIEIDTNLMKVGNGTDYYNDLPYLNRANNVDGALITRNENDEITLGNFGQSYYVWDSNTSSYNEVEVDANHPLPNQLDTKVVNIEGTPQLVFIDATISKDEQIASLIAGKLDKSGGTMTGALVLANNPTSDFQAATKQYVDSAVANAGHLTRSIVNSLPTVANANPNTIYMMLDQSATGSDKYKEYMLINGVITQIGDTSTDLSGYLTKISNPTAGNLVKLAADGSLIDTGISATSINANIGIATTTTPGLIMASDNSVNNSIMVDAFGYTTITSVSTTKLYVPSGDTLILNGGRA